MWEESWQHQRPKLNQLATLTDLGRRNVLVPPTASTTKRELFTHACTNDQSSKVELELRVPISR
jgi:hypothetical protein